MNPSQILRGEIYYVSLDPTFGWELAGFKLRPVIVVSLNLLHPQTQMVTVIPGTDATDKRQRNNEVLVLPNEIRVNSGMVNPLMKETAFQCHQIRAISQGRFTQRSRGRVSDAVIARIEDSVRFCLGMERET